jgi:hypothetical protein
VFMVLTTLWAGDVEGKKRESATELECISCCERLTAAHMHLKSSDGLYLPGPHFHW